MSLIGHLRPPFRALVLGPSQSGKTSLVRKIAFECGGYFQKIIVNSENAACNPNYLFATTLFEGNATQRIEGVINYQKRRVKEGKTMLKILLIFEDFGTLYSGSTKAIAKVALSARQYQISIITCLHRLTNAPPSLRDNATMLFLTVPPRPDQMARVLELTEADRGTLTRAFSEIRKGRVLVLPVSTDQIFFLTVEPEFRTVEIDGTEAEELLPEEYEDPSLDDVY